MQSKYSTFIATEMSLTFSIAWGLYSLLMEKQVDRVQHLVVALQVGHSSDISTAPDSSLSPQQVSCHKCSKWEKSWFQVLV